MKVKLPDFLLPFFFFVLFLLFFAQAAVPQTYSITEAQLQKLEAICQSYKANNQKLMEQLNASTQDSMLLREQLLNERSMTKSLNNSLLKYENSAAQSEAEKIQALIDLEQQKTHNQKLKKYITVLACGLVFLFLVIIGLVVLLFKK